MIAREPAGEYVHYSEDDRDFRECSCTYEHTRCLPEPDVTRLSRAVRAVTTGNGRHRLGA
jgi:hypothetical protein